MTTSVPRTGDTKFAVLVAVNDHWSSARFGPTVAEIRDKVGLSARSTVQFHLNDLIADGYLSHVEGKPRTLQATRKGKKLVRIMGELGEM